jgi:hypothetical protein
MELPKTSNVRSRMAEIMQSLKTWSASRAQSYRVTHMPPNANMAAMPTRFF